MANQNHDENIKTFEDVMSQNSASLINYGSEVGGKVMVKEMHEYEVRSEEGEQQYDKETRANHNNNHHKVETHSLDE